MSGEPFSVLVADGSRYHRGLVATLVRSAGAERVILCENADEGLLILQDRDPKLVVMDFEIGPSGALAFCRRIRRDGAAPNRAVPIIVLTAGATRPEIEAMRAAGVDAILAKPCSPLMMQEKVSAVMAQGRPFIVSAEYVGPCRRRKPDPDYRGPLRRIDDPELAAPAGAYRASPELVGALERLGQAVAALQDKAGGGQSVLSRTLLVKAVALDSNDREAAEAAQELLRYLEAVGATPRLSPRTVQVHVDALLQIVALPPQDKAMRLRLVEGLKRLVAKKLQTAVGMGA